MTRRSAARVTLAAPTDPALRRSVLDLTPLEDEVVYSNRASETLPAAEGDPTRFPVAILAAADDASSGAGPPSAGSAHVPVGFLVLDLGPRSRRYATDDDEIGVHGFFVDHRHRRRGYARAAVEALPAYVAEHHPTITSIALTVVVDNRPAVAAYLAGGMRDTGELFLGGTNGPQHVLRVPAAPRR